MTTACSGHGTPSSLRRVRSQWNEPTPPRAVTPAFRKLRRDRMRMAFSSVTGCFLHFNEFPAGDHAPEVVPTGPRDLHDVNAKEEDISNREVEMFEAGELIATQQGGQPCKLCRFVDRQA